MPQVLTANRLSKGEVVYWNTAKGWVSCLAEADVMDDGTADAALKGAAAWIRKREVVAAYLFDVKDDCGEIVPVKTREVIRAKGPTVRTDLGKQAS
jgi:hypothetical protein